ncbi:MAG TPA: methionine--tRNA ligase [Steroidobacteraceae bacterium]|nr:methionine--tRNA ligase [Steroidobacteraceae bacterium]
MTAKRRILVTSALPYANGPIHLGYLLEAVQTDIWVRFQRLRGHECHYVCADDTHGTPIMLKAQAEGIEPQTLIASVHAEHSRDLADMLIGLDNFDSTHSAETETICRRMYLALRSAGYIDKRVIRQAYDAHANMFLPDRYVKGTCPNCGAADQYGDSCEVCGATYSPADLKNPLSVVSGTPPVERDSEHHFFRLSAFEDRLREWMSGGAVQRSVAHKLEEWFAQGLKDWDISRDAPYFGFEIPDAPGKFFYVWFDAPIGYLGSFTRLCARTGLRFDDFFAPGSAAELHHFIGKDILYFHALFWPAVLQGAGMRRPTAVYAHGFVTINGQKMSKSRGTFITARRYLESFPPEYLRYFFAAKLGPGIDDLDMNLEEFASRVNSDIVGKLVNIASRCAGFIGRSDGGRLAESLPEPALFDEFAAAAEPIAAAYEARDYAAAMRDIMNLADRANRYIDQRKPWSLAKRADNAAEVRGICTQGLNLFRTLMIYLLPVLPAMAEKSARFLREAPWSWDDAARPLLDQTINAYEPLALRVDPVAARRLVAMPAPERAAARAAAGAGALGATAASAATVGATAASAAAVTIEDFSRVDLRVAKILAAEYVEGADKLLKLHVDLGDLGERQIFAGIRAAYAPAALAGRLTVVVANLASRKMRFGVSEGMVLAAGPGGTDLFLLSPDAGAAPGMRIK